jgi:translation initiation factor IF-3
MDYGKYRYDQEQKQKLARKHQSTITIKEIKLRPKIDPHDYATKKGHVVRFLRQRDKVKVTIMFRGREMSHPERGRALLERLAEDVSEIGVIESAPIQDGRNMVMLLAPVRELPPTKPGANEPPNEAPTESSSESAEPAAGAEAAKPEAAKAKAKVAKPKAAPKAATAETAAPEDSEPPAAAPDEAEPAAAAPEPEPEPTST